MLGRAKYELIKFRALDISDALFILPAEISTYFFDAIDRLISSAGRTVKVNCPLKLQIARYEP